MRIATRANFDSFIRSENVAVILLDASWTSRLGKAMKSLFVQAEHELGDLVAFGSVDVDVEGELCRASLPVGNVPAIAYFKGSSCVNIVIGLTQDIPGNIRKIMEGQVPASPAGIISRLLRPTRTSRGRADS